MFTIPISPFAYLIEDIDPRTIKTKSLMPLAVGVEGGFSSRW
jgi:hypothetical protein